LARTCSGVDERGSATHVAVERPSENDLSGAFVVALGEFGNDLVVEHFCSASGAAASITVSDS